MNLKVGVFGSAIHADTAINAKAKRLGKILGDNKFIVVTGACSGLPYVVAKSAYLNGAEVWGYSPVGNMKSQIEETPDDDISIYKKIIFIPNKFEFSSNKRVCYKFRNVLSTAVCDVGIVISGRWGTLNEFTNLIDMGKTVGVLTGTGGTADQIKYLMSKIKKPNEGNIFFNDSPKKLIKDVVKFMTK